MSQASPFSVVVSSCDAYADLWPSFFHLLFKFWPEIPKPVYLISNHKHFTDPRVQTVALGHDRHWGTNTLEAFKKIPASSILYLQDDYFLNAPADPKAIARIHRHHLASGARTTSLFNREATGTATSEPGLIECDPDNKWIFDFQAAFWDKAEMIARIEPGWTPWHAEGTMNDRAKLEGQGQGWYTLTTAAPIILPYLQAIRGGLWLPEGKALCATHGIQPDFRHRPCAPFQAGFLNRFYRSFLKRRSQTYRNRIKDNFESSEIAPISDPQ